MNVNGLKRIKKVIVFQVTTMVVLAITLYFLQGDKAAFSALLGGLSAIIPNLIFAVKLFKYQGASSAKKIVSGFYVGEFLKIISTIFLISIFLILFQVKPLAFFITYVLVIMNAWVAPLILNDKQNKVIK